MDDSYSGFPQCWPRAFQDGWTLSPGPCGNPDRYMVMPPKGHRAATWAGVWRPYTFDRSSLNLPGSGKVIVLIPHYFRRWFP